MVVNLGKHSGAELCRKHSTTSWESDDLTDRQDYRNGVQINHAPRGNGNKTRNLL